jgi:hypothetical protein
LIWNHSPFAIFNKLLKDKTFCKTAFYRRSIKRPLKFCLKFIFIGFVLSRTFWPPHPDPKRLPKPKGTSTAKKPSVSEFTRPREGRKVWRDHPIVFRGNLIQYTSLEGIWQDFRPIKIRIDWIRLDLTPDWVKVSLYHPILTRIFITTCDFYSWFWIKVIRDTDNRVNLKLDLLMLYILPISLTNFQFTLRSDCWLDFLKFYPFKFMRDTQWTF